MAWALAQLRLADAPYFDAASHAVYARSTESGLSHPKLNRDNSRFLQLMKGAQEISNIIRACGKLRYRQPSSAESLGARALQITDEFISRRLRHQSAIVSLRSPQSMASERSWA